MFCMLTGEPFSANEENEATSRSRFDEMFVFGGGGHGRRDKQVREAQKHIEPWRITDHSAAGARLVRSTGGARYKPGNLVALKGTARGTDTAAQLRKCAGAWKPRRTAARRSVKRCSKRVSKCWPMRRSASRCA